MVAGRRARGERTWVHLLVSAAIWAACTGVVSWRIGELADPAEENSLERLVDRFPGDLRIGLPSEALGTVVEVVSAVVIAIFVFAAGTAFVVAQVVPGSRGTRAVELLRTQHLEFTVAPALALTPLSCLVLLLSGATAASLATAVLIGSVVYLVLATVSLLHILGEATGPEAYGELLRHRYRPTLRKLRPFHRVSEPGKGTGTTRYFLGTLWGHLRHPSLQRAVDVLYDSIRALRAWTRTAATTGDSRELHVALQTTLELVTDFAHCVPVRSREKLPRNYEYSAETHKTNPLNAEHATASKSDKDLSLWHDWTPNSLPDRERPRSILGRQWLRSLLSRERATVADADPVHGNLVVVWVANEIGRSLVRATELGATSTALLERDRGRLLNTFAKAARRFAESKDTASLGVMAAYLVELGLGARRCPPDQILWHLEPLVVLADLHRHFTDRLDTLLEPEGKTTTHRRPTERAKDEARSLHVVTVGLGAGVLKVAEAITAARIRASAQYAPPEWVKRTWAGPVTQVDRELRDAVAVSGAPWCLKFEPLPAHWNEMATVHKEPRRIAERLAKSALLEPRDQPRLNRPVDDLVDCLATHLTALTPSHDASAV